MQKHSGIGSNGTGRGCDAATSTQQSPVMKFYKHDNQSARQIESLRIAKCNANYERHSIEWFAALQIDHLLHVVCWGIPDCYDSFTDFLSDFWSDMPWDDERAIKICQIMREDSRFDGIVANIKREWGVDFTNELTNTS